MTTLHARTATRTPHGPNTLVHHDSLWHTSTNPHVRRYATKIFRQMEVIQEDPRHTGLLKSESLDKLLCAFETIAQTFEEPFHEVCAQYYTAPNEDKDSVQNKILDTLCRLSRAYPEIPGILWHVLGHIGTRVDPYEDMSLLRDEHYAAGSAALNDAALHAMCMVKRLMFLVDDHFTESISAVIVHGHKCDCCIEAVDRPQDFTIRKRSRAQLETMFDAFMSQLVSEVVKTCGYDLPHAVV